MSQSANVRSIEAIHDFKVALATFAEEAHTALSSVEMEIRRTRDWLQRDQLSYWQSAVKKGNEQVSMARTELHRRRLSQSNSDAISDTEQKENLRAAERRLQAAEDKVKKIKSWIPMLDHAIAEYHSAAQPLGDRLTGSFQNSLALLNRMLASLDAYLNLQAPTAPLIPSAESSAAPVQTGSAATGGTDVESSSSPAPTTAASAAEEDASPAATAAEGTAPSHRTDRPTEEASFS